MYSSFYGGRDGRPFDIKKKYLTIEDMVNEFKDPSFEEVSYGDFVYIETLNKRHPDYGKLFRRDADINSGRTLICYNQDGITEKEINANGATLIACVAGPDGDIPEIEFVDAATYDTLVAAGYADASANQGSWSLETGGIVSGKNQASIDFRFLNYRDSLGTPKGAIDLKFPYPEIEISVKNPEVIKEEEKFKLEKTDNSINPFYHQFNLTIPNHLTKKQIKVISTEDFNNEALQKEAFEEVLDGGLLFVLRNE